MCRPTPLLCLFGKNLLFVVFAFCINSCSNNLEKGIEVAENRQFPPAQDKLCDWPKGNGYKAVIAEFYCTRTRVAQTNTVAEWIQYAGKYCMLEGKANQLARKEQIQLRRYDASRAEIRKTKENLQSRIVERMSQSSTMTELLELEKHASCWPESKLDSLRKIIVNKNVDPDEPVYPDEEQWISPPPILPDEMQFLQTPGLSCRGLLDENPWGMDYDAVVAIAQDYADYILPANYSNFWDIQSHAWEIFQTHESYCSMDSFKVDYPDHRVVADCWYDAAAEALCTDDLKTLLAFHRNTPHTVLDPEICLQIICLTGIPGNMSKLNEKERQQVADIRMMLQMMEQVLSCEAHFEEEALIANVVYLAENYQHHALVFDLAMSVLDYFATRSIFTKARQALETFRPLFEDVEVCEQGFYFQEGKQRWFDNFENLLQRGVQDKLTPEKVEVWNTPDHDEYNLVSWGETEEVFFVRRNRETATAQIMTSVRKGSKWTTPVVVDPLSFADDAAPLSISSSGRMILLKSKGQLYRAIRRDVGRRWAEPEVLSTPARFAENAWISPDDSLLVMDYYTTPIEPFKRPKRDIYVARLTPNDLYGTPVPINTAINTPPFNESKPIMALGGRTLFYLSDYADPLDNVSMYRVNFDAPKDWPTATKPLNVGLPISTIFDDSGITYLSEYTNFAYFHRYDQCTEDIDIWRTKLSPSVFPPNAMRLAGVVLDENDKPIRRGFMEFTANYDLNVHAEPISDKGTYTYTVANNTEVVRLFPEVPGYYSERDATHHLEQIEKGAIIRDTFRLTSFDYIRKNFELQYSTFFNGLSEFDQPQKAYPEITRLADIAERMGAELELIGHTDNSGEEAGNDRLSYERALSVKQFLVEKCGFDPDRIRVFGLGSSEPRCSNATEEGRRCNRRVQVVFKMPELPDQM